MPSEKVSVVTISFNQGEYIAKAIETIVSQDYDNLEYIVVDAGSSDASRDIIACAAKKHGFKYIFESDQGPADGLNKGFAASSGTVLGFINADDYLCPGAVRRVVDFLKKNPNKDIVSGHGLVVDHDDRLLRRTYSDPFSLKATAFRSCVLVQPSTFFRRSAFLKAGRFNAENRCAWDGELWVAMAESGARFGILQDFLAAFRVHETSITGTGKLEAAIHAYWERMFRRIVGRDWTSTDRLVRELYRIRRYLLNHRDVLQRVLHGPVYGRFQKSN